VADNNENEVKRFETGYGHPPVNTRFKKGQSGNPKGRPKGSRSLATILNRELRERVIINEGGQRKTVTKLEAAVKQISNKAASGDPVALRQLFPLIQIIEQQTSQTGTAINRLDETDQRVVKGMLKRFNCYSNQREDQ
jgi:Family of unknown function (DUF5681)